MKNVISVIVASVIITLLVLAPVACNEVPATKEECRTAGSLAQAAVDRDLGWLDILVCQDPSSGTTIITGKSK